MRVRSLSQLRAIFASLAARGKGYAGKAYGKTKAVRHGAVSKKRQVFGIRGKNRGNMMERLDAAMKKNSSSKKRLKMADKQSPFGVRSKDLNDKFNRRARKYREVKKNYERTQANRKKARKYAVRGGLGTAGFLGATGGGTALYKRKKRNKNRR